MFSNNGYTISFFENIVEEFLNDQLKPPKHEPIDDSPEMRFILKVPYVGKPFLLFNKKN